MADMFINEDQAHEWLRQAVERCGGVSKFAKRAGVSKAYVSRVMHKREAITGKMAATLGLKRVNAYELTLVPSSALQEQYEKERAAWREQNRAFFEHYDQKALEAEQERGNRIAMATRSDGGTDSAETKDT